MFYDTPLIPSSWDDLLAGIATVEDWEQRRIILRQRYLELIRDAFRPPKPLFAKWLAK